MKFAVLLLALSPSLVIAADFDHQKVKEAQERLSLKAATQPSEVDRLRKENEELKKQIRQLKAELEEFRPTKPISKGGLQNDETGAMEAIIKKGYKEMGIPYTPAKTLAEYDTQTKIGASQIRVENQGQFLEDEAAFNLVRKIERNIIVEKMKDEADKEGVKR